MGRYKLLDKLGQGSMGVVYRAYDHTLDRYVALKTMVGDFNTDTELRDRFYQEARLAAKLNHPNIVCIYDLGEVDGQMYIAMELLDGKDLKTLLKEGCQISVEMKLGWIIQLTSALSFAHRHRIIHRDIKPANVYIRTNGEVVMLDFGIARAASSKITKKRTIMGTPEYISPEQILGVHVDHRADIFALGLVSFELLTGEHPFRSPTLPATIHRVLNDDPAPPSELNAQIPKGLSSIVMKAMQKNVNNRYQSCDNILDELTICRSELTSTKQAT